MFQKIFAFLKNNSERSLALLLGVVILSLGMVFITLAWTEPSSSPPDGDDVAAPINVSGSDQTKDGRLGFGVAPSTKLHVRNGNIRVDNGEYQSWGVITLHPDVDNGGDDTVSVKGKLDMNNKKISNVLEIDPIFGIGDKKYVTYMPDEIGQKVYVVGEDELDGGEKTIDLKRQPEGSDLWLFWKAVAHNSVVPLITAQGPADLYAKVEGSELIVKSMAGKDVPFSYRLIGTRIDHADEADNLYSNQDVKSYIDIDELRK